MEFKSNPRFSDSFVFGVATSAYQIEGAADLDGKGNSIWDTFCETPGKVARNESGRVANDHYHRYAEDIALMKTLNVDAYRFSFAWTRMFPNGDTQREQRGFDFYDRLIDELLTAGIQPFGTLYHWDLPQALQDQGGWVNRDTCYRFAEYAGAVAEHFGDRVKNLATLNEPWVFTWLGYGLGYHAPGLQDKEYAIKAAHHSVLAHNLAFKAIKVANQEVSVGPVLNQSLPSVDDITDEKQMNAARLMDANMNLFWMDAHLRGDYPETVWHTYGKALKDVVQPGDLDVVANDWLGINYYFNTRVGHETDPTSISRLRVVDELAGYANESSAIGEVTDMGWPITPQGLGDLCIRWQREYGDLLPPIYITENGLASDEGISADGRVHDNRRIKYLNDHLVSLHRALAAGVDIRGYFEWSFMDNFEWAMGYEKRFGLTYVDFDTQVRTLKESAYFYRDTINSRGANLTSVHHFTA